MDHHNAYTHGYDYQDTTPDIPRTAAYRAAYKQITAVLAKLKKGEAITYGALSRKVNRNALPAFDMVLRDLAADSLVEWDAQGPAPSRVYRAK